MSDNNNSGATESAAMAERRSITMADFRTKEAVAAATLGNSTVLGQIIGEVYGVKTKEFKDRRTDEVRTALLAQGRFEATNLATGEVFQSGAAYLPPYYAEQLEAAASKSDASILFAVEIAMVPARRSDSGVPYEWEVRNLMPVAANDPLAQLKRAIGAKLRLPGAAPAAPAIADSAKDAPAEDAPKGNGKKK